MSPWRPPKTGTFRACAVSRRPQAIPVAFRVYADPWQRGVVRNADLRAPGLDRQVVKVLPEGTRQTRHLAAAAALPLQRRPSRSSRSPRSSSRTTACATPERHSTPASPSSASGK